MNVGVLYCRPECNFIISRPFPTPHLTLWNLSFTLVAITRLLFKQYFTFGLFPLSPLPCLVVAFVILRLRLLRRRGLSRVFATVKLCKGRRRWLSRRTSDAFFRLCCGALYSLRDASLVLHREVCLAWIRLLPVVCGLYTFWTIARGNALVHRKSWGYTTSKRKRKKKTNLHAFSREHVCPIFERLSWIDARFVLLTKVFNNALNLLNFRILYIILTQKYLRANFVFCRKFTYIYHLFYIKFIK